MQKDKILQYWEYWIHAVADRRQNAATIICACACALLRTALPILRLGIA